MFFKTRKIKKITKKFIFETSKEDLMEIVGADGSSQFEKNAAHTLLVDYRDGTIENTLKLLAFAGAVFGKPCSIEVKCGKDSCEE